METQVKVRVYNIDYEVYDYEYEEWVERIDFGYLTEEEYGDYIDNLQNDIIIEIDPEDIGWSMDGTETHMSIKEYIVDYITDTTGETFCGYDYEVLVDIREVKLNLLGI
jgi:hypothetical protein